MHQHRPTVLELIGDGKWMDASSLVGVISTAKEDVEVIIHTHGLDLATARELHDVTLACMIFGYLPPMRPQSICSLLHPNYKGPCLFPGCQTPTRCHGNMIMILNKEPLHMQLLLTHHKNQQSWEQAPIYFETPTELAQLLLTWLEGAHKELCL